MRRLAWVLEEVDKTDSVNYPAGPTGRLAFFQRQPLFISSPRQVLAQLAIVLIEMILAEGIRQLCNSLRRLEDANFPAGPPAVNNTAKPVTNAPNRT